MPLSLVTEQTIRDYFEMMSDYGKELKKSLEIGRANCESLINAKWDMVKADCDNSGKNIVQACRDNMKSGIEKGPSRAIKAIRKCVDEFRDTLSDSERQILECIDGYTQKALDACSKSYEKCDKALKEITNRIREQKPGHELPKIHIGNDNYDFDNLLTTAQCKLACAENYALFDNFARDSVVDAAVGAFRSSGVF